MNDADPEIEAMGMVSSALSGLPDDGARTRVLRWAADRYKVTLLSSKSSDGGRSENGSDVGSLPEVRRPAPEQERASGEPKFEDFVDLFDAVDPKSDLEKVLTAAYWFQVVQRENSWQSMKLNNKLKDTGHGVGNVTTALTAAQGRKPALVRQMAKSGKSRQARRRTN